ncbi:MAG: hypothetical protein EXX96DRAFT_617168 [Benjaminiella poitrasii]|nr:MAG: hypothetical protein EXX96DRAFT_617168 [Benjaminiella poitrasii]
MVKYSYKWPNIPSTSVKSVTEADVFKEIDRKFCGRDRCRFVLPVVITEQESKAQLHFRQLAFLAGKLDRIIVLPNVYNSHLGSCLSHPFRFYYDHSWLDEMENKGHFKYITMDEFKAWLLERHYAGAIPTGQEIHLQGTRKSRLLERVTNCFRPSFDFSGRPIVKYKVLDHHNQYDLNITDIMMNLLGDKARAYEYFDDGGHLFSTVNDDYSIGDYGIVNEKSATDSTRPSPPVDVINLFYDRRYKFIEDSDADVPLPYSQRWVDVANKISSHLKPYIAIHWRMERLEPVSNLLPCAQDLLDKMDMLVEASSQKNDTFYKSPNVFLLTDYPHLLTATGAKPESNSFNARQLRPEHHEAIQYLYTHSNITLTSVNTDDIPYDELPEKNWHILPVDATSTDIDKTDLPADRSVLGIVDKLVAMNAQWFFAGRPGVCAKSSSFTGRISRSRLNAFKNGDKNIIIPIQTFDMLKEEF